MLKYMLRMKLMNADLFVLHLAEATSHRSPKQFHEKLFC